MDDRIPSFDELSGLFGPLSMLFNLDEPKVRAAYDVDADISDESSTKRAQYELKLQRRLADLFSRLEALERFKNPGVGLTVSGWKDAGVIRKAIKILAETVNSLAKRWRVSWTESLIGGYQPIRADKTQALKLDADLMDDFRTAWGCIQGAFAREQPVEKAGLFLATESTTTSPDPESLETQAKARRPTVKLRVESRAIARANELLQEGKAIVIAELARELNCDRSYLHKCDTFMKFVRASRGDRREIPRGSKSHDGSIEAEDD